MCPTFRKTRWSTVPHRHLNFPPSYCSLDFAFHLECLLPILLSCRDLSLYDKTTYPQSWIPRLPQLHKLSSELGTWFSGIKTMLKDYISQPPLRCVWSHDCVTANTTRAEAMCLIPRVLVFLCLSSSSYVMQWQELLQPSWTME